MTKGWHTEQNTAMVDEIRHMLIERARLKVPVPVTYDAIMQKLGLDRRDSHDRATLREELADISRFEHSKQRPMLSSLARHVGPESVVFYDLAEELGYGDAKELQKMGFGKEMQKRCHEFWADDDNHNRFLNDASDEGG
jgi:hypothetical protein